MRTAKQERVRRIKKPHSAPSPTIVDIVTVEYMDCRLNPRVAVRRMEALCACVLEVARWANSALWGCDSMITHHLR